MVGYTMKFTIEWLETGTDESTETLPDVLKLVAKKYPDYVSQAFNDQRWFWKSRDDWETRKPAIARLKK
jgi:hypothetical protein